MSQTFSDLIARTRQGDESATAELLRTYEPQVRRVIRVRLKDARVRREMDSIDICQSVMGDFFVRAALGQFDLATPAQLIALLATMARNRLINHVQRLHAARRDISKLEQGPADELDLVQSAPTPSSVVANRELLERIQQALDAEERYLVEQRSAGRSWDDLAIELNANADALRMRFRRTIDRLTRRFGHQA